MSIELYAAYPIACIFIVIVRRPTATLIIANSLRHGTKAGLRLSGGCLIGGGVWLALSRQ